MSLLLPDTGLAFWMLLSFGLVFFLLAKFGFPIIVNMVEKRRDYIEQSLLDAKEANNQLLGIKSESERLMAEARSQQLGLLQDASMMRDKMIKEAKGQAKVEADKVMHNAQLSIQKERDDAMKEVQSKVAELSISIAEKLIRKHLDDKPSQMELVDKLLKEVKN